MLNIPEITTENVSTFKVLLTQPKTADNLKILGINENDFENFDVDGNDYLDDEELVTELLQYYNDLEEEIKVVEEKMMKPNNPPEEPPEEPPKK